MKTKAGITLKCPACDGRVFVSDQTINDLTGTLREERRTCPHCQKDYVLAANRRGTIKIAPADLPLLG